MQLHGPRGLAGRICLCSKYGFIGRSRIFFIFLLTLLVYPCRHCRVTGKPATELKSMIFYSSFQNSYLWLPLIGLVVGLLGTMIGGGGGFVFLPLLILLFNVPAHVAVTTSLAATLPICLLGAAGHYRKGNLDFRTGLKFGITGIIGALAGTFITGMLSQEALKNSFGIYVILLSAFLILNYHIGKRNSGRGNKSRIRKMASASKGSFFGFTGGVISGTFGTSGTMPVLAGLFAIKLPVKLIAGTSLMVIFINTVSALTGHLFLGIIDLTLILFLTAGTAIGAIAGPRITPRLNLPGKEGVIRQTFAYLMLAFGIIMIMS